MKHTLLTLTLILTLNTQAQDFASKFMTLCTPDDSITCQTVGPKMMQRLVESLRTTPNDTTLTPTDSCTTTDDEAAAEIFAKLKSARIVTTHTNAQTLYQRAQTLMEENKNRFTLLPSAQPNTQTQVYTRQHNNIIRELVMLNLSPQGLLTIVCLTGQMDEEFMQALATSNQIQK